MLTKHPRRTSKCETNGSGGPMTAPVSVSREGLAPLCRDRSPCLDTFCPPSRCLIAKAVAEYILALGLLILSAPVLLATVALIRLTSHGPAFFKQTRVGLGGRIFT